MADHTPNPPTKRCTKCGSEFPATAEFFHRQKDGKYGLRPDCKKCAGIRVRIHTEQNREKRLAYGRQYARDHRDEATERERAWRENSPEKARARSHRYYHAHAEERKQHTRNKRAERRNIPGQHTAKDIDRLYELQHGQCYYCKADLSDGYHRDHIVPLSRGGTNDIDNIVLACPQCNWSKNDRMPHEWPKGGRLL